MLRVVVDVVQLRPEQLRHTMPDFDTPGLCIMRLVVELNVVELSSALLQTGAQDDVCRVLMHLHNLREFMTAPHHSVADCVNTHVLNSADTLLPPSTTWRVRLMDHQKQSLQWMQLVEERMVQHANFFARVTHVPLGSAPYVLLASRPFVVPRDESALFNERVACFYHGAFLADATGSGKTAVTLALIASSARREAMHERLIAQRVVPVEQVLCRIPVAASLIVVPLNLGKQWMREVVKFITPGTLDVVSVFNKRDYDRLTVQRIMECDIVVVSTSFLANRAYGRDLRAPNYFSLLAITQKARTGQLTGREPVMLSNFIWRRLILDEAHEFHALPGPVRTTLGSLYAEIRWGLTGTPRLTNPAALAEVLVLSAEDQAAWNMLYPELLTATVRRTTCSLDVAPPTVHRHVVTLTSQERAIVDSYRSCSRDIIVQISTCFNVVSILAGTLHLQRGGGASAANDGTDSDSNDEEFVLMTIPQLARVMSQRHELELQVVTRQVDAMRVNLASERQLLAVLCERTGDNMEALLNHEQQQADTPAATASSSSVVRHTVRQLTTLARNLEERERQQRVVQSQKEFFQSQLAAAGDGARETCPICYDAAVDVITPCAHWFCAKCISSYFATRSHGMRCRCAKQHSILRTFVRSSTKPTTMQP